MPVILNEQVINSGGDPMAQLRAQLAQALKALALLQSVVQVSPAGEVTLKARTLKLVADQKVVIQSAANLELQAGATLSMKSALMDCTTGRFSGNTALAHFTGIVKCDVIQANTVMGTTYTPGAGNVW